MQHIELHIHLEMSPQRLYNHDLFRPSSTSSGGRIPSLLVIKDCNGPGSCISKLHPVEEIRENGRMHTLTTWTPVLSVILFSVDMNSKTVDFDSKERIWKNFKRRNVTAVRGNLVVAGNHPNRSICKKSNCFFSQSQNCRLTSWIPFRSMMVNVPAYGRDGDGHSSPIRWPSWNMWPKLWREMGLKNRRVVSHTYTYWVGPRWWKTRW